MERLTNESLENAISVYKTTIEAVEKHGDTEYNPTLDKVTVAFLEELKEYRGTEEQGLLIRLPCKIGDDVYIIPSETNFKLNILSKHEENNRVYHQKVARISFTKNGWYVECDKDIEYGTDRICVEQHFGVTWFLSPEEAEQALKKMEK